jgi:hypothetical protein
MRHKNSKVKLKREHPAFSFAYRHGVLKKFAGSLLNNKCKPE